MLIQLFINALITGAIYSLVASGFSLIYSTCRFVHFAHGATITLSAYFMYFLFSNLSLDFWLSLIFTIIFASFLGFFMNFVYKQFRKRKASPFILLMVSFAMLILFESLILIFFGTDIKVFDFIKVSEGLKIFGIIITPLQLFILLTSIILFVLLFLFMKRTKIGKAMRAVADNKDLAEILGISSEKIYLYSFIVSSLIAGVAAVLIGLEQNLWPTMGTNLMIKGFTAAIIGGIGSVPGAILGSFLLGFVENFSVWFLPSSYKDAITFILLFLFLLFRPNGILGVKGGVEK